jgi:hypothetical protein
MTVELLMNPDTLTWDDFLEQDEVIDPDSGKKVSARTSFDWDWPAKPPAKKDGEVAFPDMVLMITPDAAVWKDSVVRKDKKKAEELLSHEQFHYDVAHVIGRVLVKHLEALRAKDAAQLSAAADVLFNRHFIVRSKLIHRRYDLETKHGLDQHYQKHWKKLMRETLARPDSTQMGGWWL